jgi:hypothetical protein
MFRYTDHLELLKEKIGRSIWHHVVQSQRKRKRVSMRSIYLYTRQEMNTGSIGRSMNRMSSELQNPDQMQAYNSTYPKGGVQCSADTFVVNQTFVFQIKFCGKSPALRVAAKRYG